MRSPMKRLPFSCIARVRQGLHALSGAGPPVVCGVNEAVVGGHSAQSKEPVVGGRNVGHIKEPAVGGDEYLGLDAEVSIKEA